MNLVDPTGEAAETGWDIANVIYDVTKVGKNVLEMSYEGVRNAIGTYTNNQQLIKDSQTAWEQDARELGEALIDTGIDTLATAIPGLPAGGTKIARQAEKAIIKSEARKLAENLAMKEAVSNSKTAKVIMGQGTKQPLGDVKYKTGWQKLEYIHVTKAGEKIIVHMMKEVSSGKIEQVKVK